MIEAGTIRAYLTLNSSDFNSGLDAALERMRGMSVQSAVTAQAASVMGQSMDALSRSGLARLNATMKSSITASAQMTAAIKTDYSGAANTVASRTSQLSKQIASSLGSVQSQARSAMVRAGEGMVAGLGSMQPAILAKARSIANNVAAAMRSALKIASPSRVTRQIGEQTGIGMALGISDTKEEIEKRARAVSLTAAMSMNGLTPTVSFGGVLTKNTAAAVHSENLDLLAKKLDTLIERVSNSQQTLTVDGRSFARLLKEYS